MKKCSVFPVRNLFVLSVVLSPVGMAFAALEEFEPYASAKVLWDSNIFRVSGDDEARALLGSTSKNDTVGYFGGGFKSDFKLSRQHLFLDAEAIRAVYDDFDDLDHTRLKGRAAWGWRVGNLWNGNLGYRYQRDMRSFNESSIPEKDMRTTHTGYLDGGYQLHPDWRLAGALSLSDVSYQDRDRLERDTSSGQIEVQYRNTLNTRVGVRLKYTDYDLNDGDVAGISISNDYQETEISGVIYWEGTGKSSFEGRWGYTQQSYDDFDDRDYNGSTGRLTYYWLATGKTNVDVSVWRETSTQNDEITTYVLTKGVSIRPRWSVTPLITLGGELGYANVDYKGENDIRTALGGQRRDDDTWRYGVTASWNPRQFIKLTVGYKKVDRDSSIDVNDYDYRQVDVKALLRF
jgi:exopolysaccharide biosynthesis operon protein EpsL